MASGAQRRHIDVPRFSIRQLLFLTAIVAVFCTGTLYASPVWYCILLASAIWIVCFATIRAVSQRGALRSYWLAFATSGSALLVISVVTTRIPITNTHLFTYMYQNADRVEILLTWGAASYLGILYLDGTLIIAVLCGVVAFVLYMLRSRLWKVGR